MFQLLRIRHKPEYEGGEALLLPVDPLHALLLRIPTGRRYCHNIRAQNAAADTAGEAQPLNMRTSMCYVECVAAVR
jgi:hypothetical protein